MGYRQCLFRTEVVDNKPIRQLQPDSHLVLGQRPNGKYGLNLACTLGLACNDFAQLRERRRCIEVLPLVARNIGVL
jgi:hypothetical protein